MTPSPTPRIAQPAIRPAHTASFESTQSFHPKLPIFSW